MTVDGGVLIVVKIELHSARTGSVTELGRMVISNDGGSLNADRSDYTARVCRKGSDDFMKPMRTGHVKNWPRLSYNVWRLVLRSLVSAFPEG